MKNRKYAFLCGVILLFCINGFAQQLDISLLLVVENLKEKSNSIILNQSAEIEIVSQRKYTKKTSKTILVLNEFGLKNIDAAQYYSKNNNINAISATVYTSTGKKVKTYRKSDFIDQSTADGYSLIGDGRILYLKLTPTEYPFIVVFESEIESSNTAF